LLSWFDELERLRGIGKPTIFPADNDVFAAFELCPLDRVRLVICGQDPYHGPGQAVGLAFAVRAAAPLPPSLQNIFTELADDLGVPKPTSGDLSPWARQGVLLLNDTLTVAAGQPGSHRGRGWEQLTDAAIRAACAAHDEIVFLLWGGRAQSKAGQVDRARHHVLTAPHPSPLSARNGFFGCRHFSRANDLLERAGKRPIDWRLP